MLLVWVYSPAVATGRMVTSETDPDRQERTLSFHGEIPRKHTTFPMITLCSVIFIRTFSPINYKIDSVGKKKVCSLRNFCFHARTVGLL